MEPLNKSATAERRVFCPIRAGQKTGNPYRILPFSEPSAGEKSLAASSYRMIQSFTRAKQKRERKMAGVMPYFNFNESYAEAVKRPDFPNRSAKTYCVLGRHQCLLWQQRNVF